MTLPYELPPLPNELSSLPPTISQSIRSYAHAAIEGVLGRRGEPVGEVLAFPMDGKPQTHSTLAGLENPHPVGMLIYAAPQPADPTVKESLSVAEPVAWMQRSYLNQIRESNVALHNVVIRGSKLDGDGDVVPLFAAPQPAEPVKLPSDDERAAQGLPPYNPRLPTDEEMKRLTENGRKAWGKDDTEPARVPSDDDLLALIREHAFRQYEFDDLLSFARDLLYRYGQQAGLVNPNSTAPKSGVHPPEIQAAWHSGWEAARDATPASQEALQSG